MCGGVKSSSIDLKSLDKELAQLSQRPFKQPVTMSELNNEIQSLKNNANKKFKLKFLKSYNSYISFEIIGFTKDDYKNIYNKQIMLFSDHPNALGSSIVKVKINVHFSTSNATKDFVLTRNVHALVFDFPIIFHMAYGMPEASIDSATYYRDFVFFQVHIVEKEQGKYLLNIDYYSSSYMDMTEILHSYTKNIASAYEHYENIPINLEINFDCIESFIDQSEIDKIYLSII